MSRIAMKMPFATIIFAFAMAGCVESDDYVTRAEFDEYKKKTQNAFDRAYRVDQIVKIHEETVACSIIQSNIEQNYPEIYRIFNNYVANLDSAGWSSTHCQEN